MKSRYSYDDVASSFDQRYAHNPLEGVEESLKSLAAARANGRILEVGCGTGHWLACLRSAGYRAFGLDRSMGMLAQAPSGGRNHVVQGDAGALPVAEESFDLVFCVNALHHFPRRRRFIGEARISLRRGGCLAIVGMDPHRSDHQWFLYDFFAGTRERDLERFAASEEIVAWMQEAGLVEVKVREVERVSDSRRGRATLSNHFLLHKATSQLQVLSDESYSEGMRALEARIRRDEQEGFERLFPVELTLVSVEGRVP